MAFSNPASPVTVTETATVIFTSVTAGRGPVGPPGRGKVMVRNIDAAKTIYLGGPTVTAGATGTGFELKAGEVFVADALGTASNLYGIVAAGDTSAKVKVIFQE